ncbi:ATP-binding protein [Streptomyces sp. NPDC006285]|uniref:ATP-binding protein n=1 Tax=Streptomyces sp. NPDC006285 TaxID=3364742 RepID=UPI0036979B59
MNPQTTSTLLPVHPVGVRAAPGAAFRYIPRSGVDVTFERNAGSGNGNVDPLDRLWPRRVRSIIRKALSRWEPADFIETAELLASELVTNALEHGHGDVRVLLTFTDGRMRLDVRDGSPESPVLREASALDETGRGLFIVKAAADGWGVSEDGTTTWCTLALPSLGPTP